MQKRILIVPIVLIALTAGAFALDQSQAAVRAHSFAFTANASTATVILPVQDASLFAGLEGTELTGDDLFAGVEGNMLTDQYLTNICGGYDPDSGVGNNFRVANYYAIYDYFHSPLTPEEQKKVNIIVTTAGILTGICLPPPANAIVSTAIAVGSCYLSNYDIDHQNR